MRAYLAVEGYCAMHKNYQFAFNSCAFVSRNIQCSKTNKILINKYSK